METLHPTTEKMETLHQFHKLADADASHEFSQEPSCLNNFLLFVLLKSLLCKCCTYGYAFSNFTTGASQRQE
jgi:hypothetical protein